MDNIAVMVSISSLHLYLQGREAKEIINYNTVFQWLHASVLTDFSEASNILDIIGSIGNSAILRPSYR